jgi:25S rRNA (uracil2634-N3)-methyltransferase
MHRFDIEEVSLNFHYGPSVAMCMFPAKKSLHSCRTAATGLSPNTHTTMSKTKTKRDRRELKRDGARKIAAHQKKMAKAAVPATAKPAAKKQKATSSTTPAAAQSSTPASAPAPKPAVQASQQHQVPFGPYEHILLVGEGDFSFTRALAVSHGCANVTATSFDSGEEVASKYPTFDAIRTELEALTPPVPVHHSIDATKISSYKELRCARDDADNEDDAAVDGWDTLVFQFPHTGGLSTDVNRQVRANQALLVAFFKSALDVPDAKRRLRVLEAQANPANLVQKRGRDFLKMGGRIIVTLFEGEPYSLWNIRDLARHAGLKVVSSSRFDAAMYPGYAHVRTLGALEGGGGWKGEEREARMFVFEKVPLEADSDEEKELAKMGVKLRRKRKATSDKTKKPSSKRARNDSDSE